MKAHFNKPKNKLEPVVNKPSNSEEVLQVYGKLRQARDEVIVLQDELERAEFTATAANGMIEITITGEKYIKSVKLSPKAVDKNDIERLQDIIAEGVNAAIDAANEEIFNRMEKLTGGTTMPFMNSL